MISTDFIPDEKWLRELQKRRISPAQMVLPVSIKVAKFSKVTLDVRSMLARLPNLSALKISSDDISAADLEPLTRNLLKLRTSTASWVNSELKLDKLISLYIETVLDSKQLAAICSLPRLESLSCGLKRDAELPVLPALSPVFFLRQHSDCVPSALVSCELGTELMIIECRIADLRRVGAHVANRYANHGSLGARHGGLSHAKTMHCAL